MGGEPVLVCDLGGTRLRVAVVETGGTVVFRKVVATPKDDPRALARTMRLVVERSERSIVGAVVGVPGPVDYMRGEILRLPNLPGWEGEISGAGLSHELGIPVLLANDADLAALGEHRYGAGRGCQDMLYVTVSTGVGAGVIVGGHLLHGRLAMAEAGHTILDLASRKTLEELASGTALARAAGEDAEVVADRARQGDREARRHFNQATEALAVGVFNLVHCFSPERVVIGGGMSRSGDLLLSPIRDMLAHCEASCPASQAVVLQAELADNAGLLGAHTYWQDCAGSGQ